MFQEKIISSTDRVHLLGTCFPGEFGFYKDFTFIESIDTSNPVMAAIENKVYEFGQITGSNTTLLKIDDAAAYPVQVSGTNVTANTAGVASGQFLKIKVNGVDYKIALLNP
jgi:hypothetical protein